jgi:hypothetical protein
METDLLLYYDVHEVVVVLVSMSYSSAPTCSGAYLLGVNKLMVDPPMAIGLPGP